MALFNVRIRFIAGANTIDEIILMFLICLAAKF